MDQVVVDTLDNGWFNSKYSLLKLTRSPLQKFLIDQVELDPASRLRVGGHAELVAVSAGQSNVTLEVFCIKKIFFSSTTKLCSQNNEKSSKLFSPADCPLSTALL